MAVCYADPYLEGLRVLGLAADQCIAVEDSVAGEKQQQAMAALVSEVYSALRTHAYGAQNDVLMESAWCNSKCDWA